MNKILTVLIICLLVFGTACSSKTKTVTTTEEVTYTAAPVENADSTVMAQNEQSQVVEKKTVTEEKEEDSGESAGILGTTVGFIGDVIALPFRIVAGLIDFIF